MKTCFLLCLLCVVLVAGDSYYDKKKSYHSGYSGSSSYTGSYHYKNSYKPVYKEEKKYEADDYKPVYKEEKKYEADDYKPVYKEEKKYEADDYKPVYKPEGKYYENAYKPSYYLGYCKEEYDAGYYCDGYYHQDYDRWYYDYELKECKPFTYYGCGGNKNNYKTKEECSKKCYYEEKDYSYGKYKYSG